MHKMYRAYFHKLFNICKQGKSNGSQKLEGTTLIDIGQKIKKAKGHPAFMRIILYRTFPEARV